jgi:hemerythrin-like domain-containing protein
MADPFSMLECDHRHVERLLHQLEESKERPERAGLVEQLTAALSLHVKFEEKHVYPLTRQILDDETVEEANTEHELAREELGRLSQLLSAPGFGAAVAMVQGGIKHHVEEEEGEVFPAMRHDLDARQQADLARRLVETKRDAGPLADTLEHATKADVVHIATELGLDTKSSMTKAELSELVMSAGG